MIKCFYGHFSEEPTGDISFEDMDTADGKLIDLEWMNSSFKIIVFSGLISVLLTIV